MHGNKGKKHTQEHTNKIRISNIGKKHGKMSEEHKNKIREAHLKSGLIPPNWKGQKRSIESVEKSAAKRRGIKRPSMTASNNPYWKDGISQDINKYMIDYRRINNEKKAGRKTSELCEICGIPGSELKRGLCFDHDHNTGIFRGWLCGRCNTALGLVSDNTETLMKMIKYLKKSKSINGIS